MLFVMKLKILSFRTYCSKWRAFSAKPERLYREKEKAGFNEVEGKRMIELD